MRRRVFWVAHGMDCMIAMRLGRPLGIPLQEIDAEVTDSTTLFVFEISWANELSTSSFP